MKHYQYRLNPIIFKKFPKYPAATSEVMMFYHIAIFLAAFSLLYNTAEAASFDCSKATSTIEHLICDDSKLSGLDLDLSDIYKKALFNSTNPDALKVEQRFWIDQMRNKCSDEICLQSEYSKRINELDQTYFASTSKTEANKNLFTANVPPQQITGALENPPVIASTGNSSVAGSDDITNSQSTPIQTTAVIPQENPSKENKALIAQAGQVKTETQKSIFSEYGLYIFLAIIGAGIWHKFIRHRCPNCKATNPELLGGKELDSWIGTKEVREDLGNGKSRTRHISTTFSKIQRTYKCNTCGNEWNEISKEVRAPSSPCAPPSSAGWSGDFGEDCLSA